MQRFDGPLEETHWGIGDFNVRVDQQYILVTSRRELDLLRTAVNVLLAQITIRDEIIEASSGNRYPCGHREYGVPLQQEVLDLRAGLHTLTAHFSPPAAYETAPPPQQPLELGPAEKML